MYKNLWLTIVIINYYYLLLYYNNVGTYTECFWEITIVPPNVSYESNIVYNINMETTIGISMV